MQDKDNHAPLFISGHRKTGTTLLVSLLDSHPELSVLPIDSGFFYKYYPISETEKFSNEKKNNIILNDIIGTLESELKLHLSENDFNQARNSIQTLKNNFLENVRDTDHSPKNILDSLMRSFQTSFSNTANKIWVEKTTSSEIFASDIFNWFPNAKIIHVIRDPRDNWGSLKSGWDLKYKKFNDTIERLIQSLIDRASLSFKFAIYNKNLYGDKHYKVIKYEDLTSNPEKIMHEISTFLEIEFNEILLQPTIVGKPWKGNNFEGKNFVSVSNENSGRWKERITEHEANLIEYYFDDYMKFFDYPLESNISQRVNAAKIHYTWFNSAQQFSYTNTQNISSYPNRKI